MNAIEFANFLFACWHYVTSWRENSFPCAVERRSRFNQSFRKLHTFRKLCSNRRTLLHISWQTAREWTACGVTSDGLTFQLIVHYTEYWPCHQRAADLKATETKFIGKTILHILLGAAAARVGYVWAGWTDELMCVSCSVPQHLTWLNVNSLRISIINRYVVYVCLSCKQHSVGFQQRWRTYNMLNLINP